MGKAHQEKKFKLTIPISASQTQWDYLAVLADAIRRYGAPEAIVTDGGGFISSLACDRKGLQPACRVPSAFSTANY